MTIEKLNQARANTCEAKDALKSAAERLGSAAESANSLRKLCDSLPKPGQESASNLYSQVYADLNAIRAATGHAITQLSEYAQLLSDIMASTEIQWPPVCKTDAKDQ